MARVHKQIQTRIEELKAARDAFVADANATARDYAVAIAELERLLIKPEAPAAQSAPPEEPPA